MQSDINFVPVCLGFIGIFAKLLFFLRKLSALPAVFSCQMLPSRLHSCLRFFAAGFQRKSKKPASAGFLPRDA